MLACYIISPEMECEREREGSGTLSFLLGYTAAHHWPARLVVSGMWDSGTQWKLLCLFIWLLDSLSYKGELMGGRGRLQIKDGESLKTDGAEGVGDVCREE